MEDSFELESMSAQELSAWLKQSGIPDKFCDLFEGLHLAKATVYS